MRVLVISAAFPPMRLGEADHAFHLCCHLAKRGLEVHVLTTKSDEVPSQPNIKVHPIMRNWSWAELPSFGGFLRRCSPDVVVLIYLGVLYKQHPMVTFAPTISKALLPSVRFVTLIENAYGAQPGQSSIFSKTVCLGLSKLIKDVDYSFGTLLRDSDHIILLSDTHRLKLLKRFRALDGKCTLIPPPPIMHICPENNGVARRRGRNLLGVTPAECLLCYFGRIYPTKGGLETLLRAFQLVTLQRSHVRLVIVGGILESTSPNHASYTQELLSLPKQLGIDDLVMWTGEYRWDSDDASIYLRAADLCVLPYDKGLTLNRSSFAAAATHGLPIISTKGEMLEQPFLHRENVLLCPPQDPEAMAAAIKTLIDNPDLRKLLGLGALELAQEWFSWERATELTMATFERCSRIVKAPKGRD